MAMEFKQSHCEVRHCHQNVLLTELASLSPLSRKYDPLHKLVSRLKRSK
ncbi:hypothetical protein BIW11_03103 [Tropilaelaps mercedesae]|uniref:Uncharacterized protein n=1 Tax=Tropilaelaps mercedesae TaxID=418985 RepID=A0A1V9XSD4_9ACAR|nr:hypothetical protein BIW11_03103 [Tropilaelaps mercedesae]